MNASKMGARIAELRTRDQMTQLELAEKIGVTDRAVSKWETGVNYPDIELLPQIAEVFGISIDYLLCGKAQIRQRIEVFNVWNKKESECINSTYLAKGWKVADLKLTSVDDNECLGSVILEKEFHVE